MAFTSDLDRRRCFRIGDNHHARMLYILFDLLLVMDGVQGTAGLGAEEAFGTDPALETSFGLKYDLGFAQTQGDL